MSQSKRVLVVDDGEGNGALLGTLIESLGYESEIAEDGLAALEQLNKGVDLVLVHARMPLSDGFEVTRQIRNHPDFGDLPIVIVTALTVTDTDDRPDAIAAGANDFILKPIDATELQVRMASLFKMKETQDALRYSEQKYRELVEHTNSIILRWNRDGHITFLNEFGRTFFRYREDEILGRNVLDTIVPVIDREGHDLAQMIRDIGDRPERYVNNQNENKLRDGERVWISWTNKPVFDKHGTVVEILSVGNDLTDLKRAKDALKKSKEQLETKVAERTAELKSANERLQRELAVRKRTEEALRESEERYRAVFNNAAAGINLLDRSGRFIEANSTSASICGYTQEELRGLTFYDLTHPEDREASREALLPLQRGERDSYRLEKRYIRKDGKVIWAEISVSALRDARGEYTATLAVVVDITERKKSEQERESLQKQLLQAQKMEAIGTLAGGIAHDFNNLLQAVLGYTDLLLIKKGPEDPDRKKLEVIQHAARDGADLVARILTFSRKGEFRTRPLELNDEIRRVAKLLHRTLPRMIEIDLLLADDLSIIDADPAQIEQVILNLGVNARHAMPEGGRLTIETSNVSFGDECVKNHVNAKQGKYVLLTVSDTGSGMSPQTLDRIFEPFFTTKTNEEGTGLGLAMVHGIVAQHGGYVRCYSEPGSGASFKIYFPVSSAEPVSDLAVTREMPAFGTETVLLVDDDDRVREMARQIIEMGGYKVLVAPSGEDGLVKYAAHKKEISLVILDLIMPGIGGKLCLEKLLRIDPDARVIVASGYSSNGLTSREMGSGAMGFVSKPYDAKDILGAIRKVLDLGKL